MKRIVLLTALLALAACQVQKSPGGPRATAMTTYDKASNINGKVTHVRMVMTSYVLRAALGNNPNTAAYVTIRNEGDAPDRLLSASCDCAGMVMLHDATMAEPAGGFVVAPGQDLVFAPGGNHIMLSDLKTRPKNGGVETLVLHFQNAGDLSVVVPVSDKPQDHKH